MPAFEASDDEWFQYCLRDCEVCEVAVLTALRSWVGGRCGVWQPTAPALAMTNWRHTLEARTRAGESIDVLYDSDPEIRKVEREAFLGGRVEPFHLGEFKGTVHKLDVNSMYPAMMSSGHFPRASLGKLRHPTPQALLRKTECYGAVAQVLIHSRIDTYPVKIDGLQLHCNGQFGTTLCGQELRRALVAGHVARVYQAWTYSLADLFNKWVEHWYGVKVRAKAQGERGAADYELAKLMLVGLVGRFAIRGDYWRDDERVPVRPGYTRFHWKDHETGQLVECRSVAGVSQSRDRSAEPEKAMPVISAFITSAEREYLRLLLSHCPAKSVLYVGTDSLICTDAALGALRNRGLVHDTDIGKLRVEGTADRCLIEGCNQYTFGNKRVASGLWSRSTHWAGGIEYADHWQGIESILATRPNGTVNVVSKPLSQVRPTPKGRKQSDGWVEPYRLTCDPDFTDWPPRHVRELPALPELD